MAATTPPAKICACQFNIDEGDFEFASGTNLAPPSDGGLTSLMQGFIDAFIAAIAFPIIPLQLILDADVLGLLDWVATATSDIVQFFLDMFDLLVLSPFTSGIKVFIPTFNLDLGIANVPIPPINSPAQAPYDTPQWAAMVSNPLEGIISLFKMLLLFPFNAVKGILDVVIGTLSFPSVDIVYMQNIWDVILAASGLVVGTPTYDSVSKLGGCFLEQIEPLIPPIFPSGGASLPVASYIVKQGITIINHEGEYNFNLTGVPVNFTINRDASDISVTDIQLSGGQSDQFTLVKPSLPVTLTAGSPQTSFIVTFNPTSTGTKEATIAIVSDDPDDAIYTFKVKGTT